MAGSIGLCALIAGLVMAANLASGFRTADLLYQQPVSGFAAWLSARPSTGGAGDGVAVVGRQPEMIADRLLHLPVSSRRAILSAVMDDAFWSSIAGSEAQRMQLIGVTSQALQNALSRAPLSGAMWLAAAKLRTLQNGFDATAETYLRRSYILAPREAGVAADRLGFLASVRPLLRANLDSEIARDGRIVCQSEPSRYRALADFLALPVCDRV